MLKCLCLKHFKRMSFCQDRLGTIIGKALRKRCVVRTAGPWSSPVVVLAAERIDSNLSPVIAKDNSLLGLWRGA